MHSECEYTLCPPGPRRVWWCHSPGPVDTPGVAGVETSCVDDPGVARPGVEGPDVDGPGVDEPGVPVVVISPLGSRAPQDLHIAHSTQCQRPAIIN